MKEIRYKLQRKAIKIKAKLKNISHYFTKVPNPEKWVFIVGSYNSGTTLLHSILSKHPKIGSMPLEGIQFTNELQRPDYQGVPRLWAIKKELFYLDENKGETIDIKKIKRQWAFMYNHPDRPVLMEKSIVNAARTRWLQKHFNNSYFIILMRNGYAIAEGIRRKGGHDIEKSITQWKQSYEIVLHDMEFLKNKIFIRYEDFTERPKFVLDNICDFIGVNHLPDNTIEKKFKIDGETNKITNLNGKSMERLSKEDIEIINRIGGELLLNMGYSLEKK